MTDENEREDEVHRPFPWQEFLQRVPRKEWFTWGELLEHGGLLDFELIEYIKKGLQPYLPARNPIHCPYKWHLYKYYIEHWQGAIQHYLSTEETADWLNDMGSLLKGSGDDSEDGRILLHPGTKERLLLVEEDENIFHCLVPEGLYEWFWPAAGGWAILLSQETLKRIWDRVGVLNQAEELKEELERLIVEDPGLNAKPSPRGLRWEFLAMPSTDEELRELIQEARLREAIFKRENLETLAREDGVEPEAGKDASAAEKADDVVVLIEEKKPVETIDKNGRPHVRNPRWRVEYRGEAATILSMGMNCYAELYELAEESPDAQARGVSPPELLDMVLGRKAPEKTQAEQQADEDFPEANLNPEQLRWERRSEAEDDSSSGRQIRDSDRNNMDLRKEDGEKLRQEYSKLRQENPDEVSEGVKKLAGVYETDQKTMWLFLKGRIPLDRIRGKDRKFDLAKRSILKAMGTARSQLHSQKLDDLAQYLESRFLYKHFAYCYKPPEKALKFKITWCSD